MKRSIALAIVWIALLTTAAPASTVPKLQGRVNDYAHVLSAEQERNLTDLLRDEEDKTSNQIVILTIDSLGGDAIETYANQVFQAWRLGQAHKENGVLLVAAIKDHRVRIEVGKGLEGALTDALSSQIIRNEIVPKFKVGDYGGGLSAGVAAIDKAIRGEYRTDDKTGGGIAITLVTFLIFFLVLALYVRSRRSMGWGRGFWNTAWSGSSWGSSSGGGFFDDGSGGGGGFSGGGGSSGGGGASGSW